MDLWVVAAAAGAGYIAKNLQNLSVDREESLVTSSFKYSHNAQSESRNFLQQLRDKTCPLRRLARQRGEENDMENHSDVNFSEIHRLSTRVEEAGVSGEESLKFEDGEDRNFSRVDIGKLVRSRRCHVHSMRPLNSLESRLDIMEHGTCFCPSTSAVRPLLVTDGMWSNSSSFTTFDSCVEETRREDGVGNKVSNAESSSSLKQFESVEELRKLRKSFCSVSRERASQSQGHDTMLLFITGMTIGILSATTAWKNEVDNLNKLLKQMQNLVQDLHEELDMKEVLMVKELTEEGDLRSGENDTPASLQEPISSPSDGRAGKLNKYESFQTNEKNTDNLDLLSRIEAELQAELEMLEQNMKVSALERISSVVELDPDFEPEIAQGDLKPVVNNASESGNETTDTATDSSKPANYAVSPTELSLRLHELIESRLEMRIKELEMALRASQNRVQVQGSQSIVSGKRFSYSETESSSTHQSPTCLSDEHDKETNGVLDRVTDKDQETEDAESGSKAVHQGTSLIDLIWNREYDFISHHGVTMEEDGSETLVQDMPETRDKQRSTSCKSNEDSMSEDEGNDVSEMLLIKQIVERRRSGSSLNLKIA